MMGLLNWDMIGISLEYNISIYIYIYIQWIGLREKLQESSIFYFNVVY